jgi:hypothetical protein
MSNRECSHDFYCWYRLEGRCCHGAVEDIASCKGHEPSSIYVELNSRWRRTSGKEPTSEQDTPRDSGRKT